MGLSNIFWDYKDIDLNSEAGIIIYLNRKIMFGQFDDDDIPNIKKYYDKLDMADYRKYYFMKYFQKYDIN